MTVSELIEILKGANPDAEVRMSIEDDGGAFSEDVTEVRMLHDAVWLL